MTYQTTVKISISDNQPLNHTDEPQTRPVVNESSHQLSDISSSTVVTTREQLDRLLQLCELSANSTEFRLLYRGSEHGFSSDAFHSRCDKISPTLTLIRTSVDDYIFGGYTEAEWDRDLDGYKIDYHAYLFSLVNKYDDPQKLRIKSGGGSYEMFAVYSSSSNGPCFGDAYESSVVYSDDSSAEFDLYVADEANSSAKSYTKLVDVNYKNGRLTSTEEPFFFQVKDIEVYKVIL